MVYIFLITCGIVAYQVVQESWFELYITCGQTPYHMFKHFDTAGNLCAKLHFPLVFVIFMRVSKPTHQNIQ
jgi:hypothetical protein